MRPANAFTALSLALFVLVTLTGCARSERGAVSTPPSGAATGEPPPMRLTEAGEVRAPARPPPAQWIDPRDTAFAGHRLTAPPLYPSDFTIGSLRTAGLSAVERGARQAAVSILTAVRAGQPVPQTLVDPTPGARVRYDELAREATGVRAVRVGRPVSVGRDELAVPFVLLGDRERWSGELIMESSAGRWYSSDIQANRSRIESIGLYAPGIDVPGSW